MAGTFVRSAVIFIGEWCHGDVASRSALAVGVVTSERPHTNEEGQKWSNCKGTRTGNLSPQDTGRRKNSAPCGREDQGCSTKKKKFFLGMGHCYARVAGGEWAISPSRAAPPSIVLCPASLALPPLVWWVHHPFQATQCKVLSFAFSACVPDFNSFWTLPHSIFIVRWLRTVTPLFRIEYIVLDHCRFICIYFYVCPMVSWWPPLRE